MNVNFALLDLLLYFVCKFHLINPIFILSTLYGSTWKHTATHTSFVGKRQEKRPKMIKSNQKKQVFLNNPDTNAPPPLFDTSDGYKPSVINSLLS